MPDPGRYSDKVQDSRRRVDQADHLTAPDLAWNQTRRSDQQRNVDVLLEELKGVSVVAVMLAERLAVIAQDDP